MIDLRQKELEIWQAKNFDVDKESLFLCALGMAEEVGELSHSIIKGTQKIREGIDGINKENVADAFADVVIYGIQVLSLLGIDAEDTLRYTISYILKRDWIKNPVDGGV